MRVREGDLIEAVDGNIFDVKGLVHPPDRVIAFIRFTPDPNGDRMRRGTRYKKVYALRERYELLRRKFPQYLVLDPVFNQWFCEVPVKMVKRHYEPSAYLRKLQRRGVRNELEKHAFELAKLLRMKSGVEWSALGISGSLLVGLHTPKSDIDLVVYGSRSCRAVYNTLISLAQDKSSNLRSYAKRDLESLFDFRSKDTVMEFEDFVRTESRKVLQGRFRETDYYIRCVKAWSEISETYGTIRYRSVGDAKVKAAVIDDSDMIFTPCVYKIENVRVLQGINTGPLREIVSFRGRFCEQARNGEEVAASGMVESVETGEEKYSRLLIGNKPSDYLIPAK